MTYRPSNGFQPTEIVIMAKKPVAGTVKTRLARQIGSQRACQWQRIWLARLLRVLSRDPRFRANLALAPIGACYDKGWRPGLAASMVAVPRSSQGYGDLGARMWRQMQQKGTRKLIILGADVPELLPKHLAAAASLLGRADFVLGPSADGGYWLFGRRAGKALPGSVMPGPLRGVTWSVSTTRKETVDALSAKGERVSMALPEIADIDDGAELYQYLKRRHEAF